MTPHVVANTATTAPAATVVNRDNPVSGGIEVQILDSHGKKKLGPQDHGQPIEFRSISVKALP